MLLVNSRQKPRHIHKSHNRNVERVAEPHKPSSLNRRVDVQGTSEKPRLIRHNSNCASIKPSKAYDNVGRPQGLNLQEVAVVHYAQNNFPNIVRLVRVVGHNLRQTLISPIRVVASLHHEGVLHVVRRQKTQQLLDNSYTFLFVVSNEMRHPAGLTMNQGASQILKADLLSKHSPNHVWSSDEHVACLLHHNNKVG